MLDAAGKDGSALVPERLRANLSTAASLSTTQNSSPTRSTGQETGKSDKPSRSSTIAIATVVPILAVFFVALGVCAFLRRRRSSSLRGPESGDTKLDGPEIRELHSQFVAEAPMAMNEVDPFSHIPAELHGEHIPGELATSRHDH